MKMKIAAIIMFLSVPALAQIRPEILGGYTVNNNREAGYNSKTIHPFVVGANLKMSMTRKKYSPTEVYAVVGARYMRTGMRSVGSIPDGGDFYEDIDAEYLVNDEGHTIRLEQAFASVPVGFEFKVRGVPVRNRPLDYFSLTLMLNNAMPLKSTLKETLALENGTTLSQEVDFIPYLKKYYPGFTAELRLCNYILVGVCHQEVTFKGAADVVDFDDQAPSAFYKFITNDGFYRDVNWYVGLVIPVGKSKKQK